MFYVVSYVFWEKFACGVYRAFLNVVFVCLENDVCEDGVCSVYISGGGYMPEKAASMSVVNCIQFAFL